MSVTLAHSTPVAGPSVGPDDAERAAYKAALLKRLNEHQAEAVALPHVSALVLAGAGSGKTSVLTARIAYLINDAVSPRAILAVTFTNKAAEEMKKRLAKTLGRDTVEHVWVGTFHSLCNRILREQHEAAGLPKNFAILDPDAQEVLVRPLLKDIYGDPTDPFEVGGEDEDGEKLKPRMVVDYINKKKEFGVRPFEIDPASGTQEELLVELYRRYQKACATQGLLDFNDLLHKTVELLEANTEVRQRYAQRFDAILVDEFQDTNDVQYRWLELLKAPHAFVMAVGDDDQSIYGFRGANPKNMQRFVREIADDRIIKLERNYRSLPYILESANAVIARNGNRLGKDLWTQAPDAGEKIACTEFGNGYFEASYVARRIHSLIRDQKVPPAEIAALYRTNMQSRLLEQELNKLGVPLTVYGGFRFYERQEVKHLLAYLDLACSLDRDISFSRVVNFPPRGLGERTIEDLRQEAKQNAVSMMAMVAVRSEQPPTGGAAAQRKQELLEDFAGLILDLSERAQANSLAELIESIVANTGMVEHYEAMGPAEAEERMGNIGELVSAARQFELEHPELKTAADLLPEYLAFVQLMSSTSEADMDKKNTVSLMTVHSAKGLEFDNVFVTGLEDGTFPHARAIAAAGERGNGKSFADHDYDVDPDDFEYREGAEDNETEGEEIEEERRLMYVAMTRARKHLEITFAAARMINGDERTMPPSRFLAEIPKERLARTRERQNPGTYANKNGAANKGAWGNKAPAASGNAPQRRPFFSSGSGSRSSAPSTPLNSSPGSSAPGSRRRAPR